MKRNVRLTQSGFAVLPMSWVCGHWN